jgi:hypothetical protein
MDNLGKGASGAAAQNLDIMFGLESGRSYELEPEVETRILAHARVPAYDNQLCNRIAAVNPLLVAGAGVTRTLAARRERDGAGPRHQ